MSCDLLAKCRTCLCDSHIFHQLYDYVDENYKIVEMLEGIVPQIDIKTSSNYSSLMCQSCVDKLVAGHKFQQLCIETNKRLHDLMRISHFETVPKFGKMLDPLIEASFKTNIDVEDDSCFECKLYSEELEETSDNNNDVGPVRNTDNDTDYSNGELSVLKLRNAHKSPPKSDEGERPSKNNRHKGQFTCSESEKDVEKLKSLINEIELDMKKVSTHIVKEETKLTPQIFTGRMDELGAHSECFINDFIDSDDNSEKNAFTKPGAKHIKNMDFIDTGKRKDGGPNKINGNFPCEDCGNVFTSANSLKRHSLAHSITRPQGSDWPIRFAKQKVLSSNRKIHARDKAETKYPCLVCPICDKEFGNTNSFKQHKRTHRGKGPFLCTECGRTFRNIYTLRLHKDRHRDLRNYQCPECLLRFNTEVNLKQHTQTHTKVKHVCDLCGSSFTLLTNLRTHMKLHSEERPFKCDQCGNKYAFIYYLQRHMDIHTIEKPHKCKFCERAFKRSRDLTSHLRIHVGENTYMCDQCPMAFKKHFELKLHKSEHYKITQNLPQRHQPIHNHNQQIIIADQNQHITIEISNHQQISLVDHHSQQLSTIVEQTSAAESRTQSR